MLSKEIKKILKENEIYCNADNEIELITPAGIPYTFKPLNMESDTTFLIAFHELAEGFDASQYEIEDALVAKKLLKQIDKKLIQCKSDMDKAYVKEQKQPKIGIVSDRCLVENIAAFLSNMIDEYNDYEEEHVHFSVSPFEIVQDVLLKGTDHSGGSSTYKKLEELGLDNDERWSIGTLEEEYELD